MDTKPTLASAKILQFTSVGRAIFAGRCECTKSAIKKLPSCPVVCDCGGAWYHAAAIAEEETSREQ